MFQHDTKIRVRYADTDQMGYVYYGNYARFFEIGRVESLRTLGMSYRDMEAAGVMMPVLENHSKYLAPAHYDEELTIRTIIKEMPGVRIKFFYEVVNESGKLIHEGETMLAFVNMESGRPCRMPADMAEVLAPYFDNERKG